MMSIIKISSSRAIKIGIGERLVAHNEKYNNIIHVWTSTKRKKIAHMQYMGKIPQYDEIDSKISLYFSLILLYLNEVDGVCPTTMIQNVLSRSKFEMSQID